jgi:hypothetical protein
MLDIDVGCTRLLVYSFTKYMLGSRCCIDPSLSFDLLLCECNDNIYDTHVLFDLFDLIHLIHLIDLIDLIDLIHLIHLIDLIPLIRLTPPLIDSIGLICRYCIPDASAEMQAPPKSPSVRHAKAAAAAAGGEKYDLEEEDEEDEETGEAKGEEMEIEMKVHNTCHHCGTYNVPVDATTVY